MTEQIDDLCVPEFFANTVRCECAGGMNLRCTFYTRRGNRLVPSYSAIHSIEDLVEIGRHIRAALKAMKEARGLVN